MKKIVSMLILCALSTGVTGSHNMTEVREAARELAWIALPWAMALGFNSKDSPVKSNLQMTSYFSGSVESGLRIPNLVAVRYVTGDPKAALAAEYVGAFVAAEWATKRWDLSYSTGHVLVASGSKLATLILPQTGLLGE